MAVSVDVKSFTWNSADSVGTTYTVSFGFTVKHVTVWTSGRSGSVDAVGGQNVRAGIGFAASTTQRVCCGVFSADGAGNGDAQRGSRNDSIVAVYNASGVVGLLDINASFTTDVVFVIDDQIDVSIQVFVRAIGGSDITNVFVGEGAMSNTTGNETVSAVGFQGDFIEICRTGTGSINSSTFHGHLEYGCATATAQAVVSVRSEDGPANSDTDRYMLDIECSAFLAADNGVPVTRGSFVGFTSNGFTINWLETLGAYDFLYSVIKGGRWRISPTNMRNDSTQFSITGWPATPRGIWGFSHGAVESTQDASQTNSRLSFGCATGSTNRLSSGFYDDNAQGTTRTGTIVEYDEFLASASADVTDWLCDVVSFNSDGVTFVMDDFDPTLSFAVVVGFFDSAPAGAPSTLPLLGVGT